MARSTARVTRALMAAGGIALVCASPATAATFKNDSGKLAAAAATGVTASGGTLQFTGAANPTGSVKFAGQIDFTSGQATGLRAPGKLTLKHSGHTATLKITKISGKTLTAKLGSKQLTFPLSLSNAKSTPNAKFTGVAVTGVAVNLSSADATALNGALKTRVYKSGKKFGTLRYSGIDRELIENSSGGPLTLCDAKKFDAKNTLNNVTPSPVSPATVTASPCNGTNDDGVGLDFPKPGKTLGFFDTASGHGRITLKGGILDTQASSGNTAEFKNPILDLLGANSDLRATLFANGTPAGVASVATVSKLPAPTIKEAGATLSVPADGATVALNATGAAGLNFLFCTNTTCAGGKYAAGNKIGYSGGTIKFK